MAMSGNLSSKKYNGAYWYFKWTATQTGVGKTTVKWELYTKGRSTSPTEYYTKGKLKIQGKVEYEVDAKVSFNNKKRDSGSFELNHDNDGSGSFKVQLVVDSIFTDVSSNYFGSSATFNLDVNYPYTPCTAPTEIVISPKIQKPGGDITISWSGAQEGIANPISKYAVSYWFEGEEPNAPYLTTDNTSELTINLPSDIASSASIRAKSIFASVQAIGAAEGYNSEVFQSDKALCLINSLPETPKINEIDKDLLKSSGDTVTFNLDPGKDADESQIVELYYSTQEDGEKTKCEKIFSSRVSKTTAFYFWSYDGIEFSQNYIVKEIKVNSKPKVLVSVKDNEVTFTPKDGQEDQNIYKFGIKYGATTYQIGTTQSSSYIFEDIRKIFNEKNIELNFNQSYNYTFWAQRNDGIEDSVITESSEMSFTTPMARLLNDNEAEAAFSKKVYLILSSDNEEKFTSISIGESEKINPIEKNEFDVSNFNFGEKIKRVNFNNSFYITPKQTLTKVKQIEIVAPSGEDSPFTPKEFNAYQTSQLNLTLAISIGDEYGLDTIPEKISLKYGDQTLDSETSFNIDKGIGTYSFSGTAIYDTFLKNTEESSPIILRVLVKNKFGDEFSQEFSLNVAYSSSAAIKGISFYTVVDNVKYELDKWDYLKEGMIIYGDLEIFALKAPKISVQTRLWTSLDEDDKGWKDFGNQHQFQEVDGKPVSDEEFENLPNFNEKPNKYTLNKEIGIIEEILKECNIDFKINVHMSDNSAISKIYSPKNQLIVKPHRPCSARFTSVEFLKDDEDENNDILKMIWQFTDNGGGEVSKVKIKIDKTEEMYSLEKFIEAGKDWDQKTWFWKGKLSTLFNSAEFLRIAPCITTELYTSVSEQGEIIRAFKTEKVSNEFVYYIIYNTQPTVSYRKNCIGINTSIPSSFEKDGEIKKDAVAVISAHNGRDKIYLKHNEKIIEINLADGKITGVIINGGSW